MASSATFVPTTPSRPFPVPIICPRCSAKLSDGECCSCTDRTRLKEHHGIPRVLFGQKYWGETSSANMRRILDLCTNISWREALRTVVGNTPLYSHLTAPIRADVLHAIPWTRIKTVLDVGAGMGFMACDMAAYAENIIALEAVPERAEFIQVRARQEGLNVWPIIADALELPFAPESFDLITLNGAFEYIGLRDTESPKTVQLRFLRELRQHLKPGGLLYIGTEARFGWPYWFGLIDHSGLRFTSLMPRFVANVYCKIRAKPFFGSEHSIAGYRTYTYTPRQYTKMVHDAGFENIRVSGAFPGYSEQRIIYDIANYDGRRHTLDRYNPSASTAGRWRRKITDNRWLHKFLEPELIVFARRPPDHSRESPLPWDEIRGPSRTLSQINTATKVLTLVFESHEPTQIFESAKLTSPEASARISRAYKIVECASTLYARDVANWPMCWPSPLGERQIDGRSAYGYEFIAGRELSTLLLPVYFDPKKTLPLLTRAMHSYVDFCLRLGSRWPAGPADSSWTEWSALVRNADLDTDVRGAALDALAFGQRHRWPLHPIHGDFGACNVVIPNSGRLVLVDWEHFSPAFLPAVDLIRFGFDVLSDAALLSERRRQQLVNHVRATLIGVLTMQGFSSADYPRLHALFIAHQLISTRVSIAQQTKVISRYSMEGDLSPFRNSA